MALLDTINMIEERRDRVMNRRQNRMAQGEQVKSMPVPKERLRMAMSHLDELYKENRMKYLQKVEQQQRMTQAMQMVEQQQQQPQQQPQQPQQQMPQQQMATQQAPQGLLGMPR